MRPLIYDIPSTGTESENEEVDEDVLLMEAAKSGKENEIRNLLFSGCQSNVLDALGRSALHWAAEYGYLRVVYLLLDSDWDVNWADNKVQTPLHIACNHHRADIATCLVSFGCDINVADISGNTPLHRAVHTNLITVVYMLCTAGANINAQNVNGWTPLHEAVRVGNEDMVSLLLRSKADINAATTTKATPFLTAVFYFRISHRNSYPSLDIILKMLLDNRCRLSQPDRQWSPLSAAICIYNSYIAGVLLFHGCQIERRVAKWGRSLLVEAFTRCDDYVVKLLVMSGYQVSLDEVEQCAKRIPSFSRAFLKLAYPGNNYGRSRYIDTLYWLRQRAGTPFKLYELARMSIRESLNNATNDTSILDFIPGLPLPDCLRNYVAMDEMPMENCFLP